MRIRNTLILVALSVSAAACAVPGLGPDYRASDAYVQAVIEAGNPPPTEAQCRQAASMPNLPELRDSDRRYLSRKRGDCANRGNRAAGN